MAASGNIGDGMRSSNRFTGRLRNTLEKQGQPHCIDQLHSDDADYLGAKPTTTISSLLAISSTRTLPTTSARQMLTYDIGGTASCSDVGISIAERLATKLKER